MSCIIECGFASVSALDNPWNCRHGGRAGSETPDRFHRAGMALVAAGELAVVAKPQVEGVGFLAADEFDAGAGLENRPRERGACIERTGARRRARQRGGRAPAIVGKDAES